MRRIILFAALLAWLGVDLASAQWLQVGGDKYGISFSGATPYVVSSFGRILWLDSGRWKLAATCPALASGIAFRGRQGVVTGLGFSMSTQDGGVTWQTNLHSIQHTPSISFPSSDTVYNLTYDRQLIRSTDLGRTWTVVGTFGDLGYQGLDFANGRVGYLSKDARHTERTTDGGETWKDIGIDSVLSIKCFGDTLVCGSWTSISVSTDKGETWRRADLDYAVFGNVNGITRSAQGRWIAIGLGGGFNSKRVAHSIDQGRSWQFGELDLQETFVRFESVSFGPTYGLCSGMDGVIYASYDEGQNWQRVANCALLDQFSTTYIYGVSVGRSGRLFVAASSGSLQESTDEGLTWIEHEANFNARGYRFIHEFSDSVLITCGEDFNYERSTDGGKTWKGRLTMPPVGYSRIRQKEKTLWMAGSNYIFRSLDSGITWSVIDSVSSPIWEFIILPNGQFAVVGGRGGSSPTGLFAISDTNAMHWVETNMDSPGFGLTYLSTDTLIASGKNGRIWISTDLGKSWTVSRNGPEYIIHKLANLNDTLLIGASYDGIIESRDRGKSWEHVEFPSLVRRPDMPPTNHDVIDVAVTKNGRVIAGGSDMIFVRNLVLDPSEPSSAERDRPRNIYLRIKPYPNPAIDGKAKASIWGLATVRGEKRQLALYDMLGVKVMDLSDQVNRDLEAVSLDVEFDTRGLASGTYMLVLDAGGDRLSQQIVVF